VASAVEYVTVTLPLPPDWVTVNLQALPAVHAESPMLIEPPGWAVGVGTGVPRVGTTVGDGDCPGGISIAKSPCWVARLKSTRPGRRSLGRESDVIVVTSSFRS
jgi:hypothetical protein